MEHIGIIGCGVMGAGIAQVMLQGGCKVLVCESTAEQLQVGLERIDAGFDYLVGKGKFSGDERGEALSRLRSTTDLDEMADQDLIIEAVFEDVDVKKGIFKTLDKVCRHSTVFASNTSSMSITELAAATGRGGRFLGLHFFNPAPLMPLVEVVKTIITDEAIVAQVFDFVRAVGKTPVVAKDNAGFIVNALTTPFLLDAMRAVSNGMATIKDIDTAIKLGMNHPLGPLMLSDLIGLDILYNGSLNMYRENRDSRYAPPPVLRKLVMMNFLGKKTRNGFYNWSDPKNPVPSQIGL